ncbi:MAG: biopolymer transporter ExbD [Burkholderiaceae bacterium]|nr:biopolymer transporter ExbD [Burkholderiaceae bacterium]
MAFGSFENPHASVGQTMSEINMVPLIDVVLVLLVLFILAAPMAAQSVQVNLPKVASEVLQQPPKTVDITLTAMGERLAPDGQPLTDTQLVSWLKGSSLIESHEQSQDTSLAVRIWSDQDVRYVHLAKLIAVVRQAGVSKVSLMTRKP